MKIAFIYDVPYPWHVGGIEEVNFREAAELAKRHEVHFFTLRWPGMKAHFKYKGIHYHTFHETAQEKVYRHRRRSVREAFFFAMGMSNLFKYRFDVIVANQYPILHLPLLQLYCKTTGCKLIMEVAEVWDKEYWRRYIGPLGMPAHAFDRTFITKADLYIANSSTTAKKLEDAGAARGRIRIFTPVIEENVMKKARRAKIRRDDNLVVFSGRMVQQKRLDKWLDAINTARKINPKIKGLLIGNGAELQHVKEKISELRLNNVVSIKDFTEKKEGLYREFRKAALLLNMSEREGLSVVAIESIAVGTPVLLPDYTPIPKEVKEMCVVVSENDVPKQIAKITQSRNKQQFIRNSANLRMFSTSNIAPFFSKLFSDLGLADK